MMKNSTFWHVFILGAVVFIAFSPALSGQFLNWDDFGHYVSNPFVYSLSWINLVSIFKQIINLTYIPLTTLSFNLEYHLFGVSAFVSHLINLFLHFGVAWVIYLFAKKLKFSNWESLIAAGIFALHPMRVESVAWVTERKDVLGILFYVLCLKRYWQYLETNSKKDFAISLLFGFLSVLTKSMAVSIPWVLLLLDWYHQRRWNKYVILDKIPFALVIFPIVAITFFSLAPNPHIKSQSLLVGLWSLTWYLEKFLLPFNLLPIYAAPFPVEIFNLHYLKAVLIFFVLGTSLWIGRQNRLFVFACVFWAATIFMFWRFDFTDKNIVADRFMYLPCIGFSLLMGKYLSRIKWASVLLLLIFSFLSYKQCAVWQNDTSLWSWIIKNDPKVTLARGNYDHIMHSSFHNIYNFKELAREIDQNPHKEGPYIVRAKALITQRNPWIALRDLNQALKINPNSLEALTIRGQMYMVQASFKEALVDMNRALELDKTNPYMYLQKGSCHLLMNQFEEAMVHFSKALVLNPKLWTAYNQRAYLYVTKGQYQEAIKDFTELIKAEFELSNSYYMRGKCHEELGEYKLAIEDLKKSSSLEPNHYKISEELAILYLKNNNSESSLEVLNKSISAHPYRDNGYLERAKKHLNEKKYALVIEDCSKVIDLISNPYAALIMRGDAYLAQGEEALALKDYNRAKSLLKGTLSFEVLVSKDTSKASSIK